MDDGCIPFWNKLIYKYIHGWPFIFIPFPCFLSFKILELACPRFGLYLFTDFGMFVFARPWYGLQFWPFLVHKYHLFIACMLCFIHHSSQVDKYMWEVFVPSLILFYFYLKVLFQYVVFCLSFIYRRLMTIHPCI